MVSSSAHPLVTIGVLSWNRLHYLRAVIASARRCIRYPRLEWIVSDNRSEEPGLRPYVEHLEGIDHKLFKRQSHAAAMNQIVELAAGDFIMLLPDDAQFVLEGSWLRDMVELLQAHDWIGSVVLDFMSRQRNQRQFGGGWIASIRELSRHGRHWRRPRLVSSRGGYGLRTLGSQVPGIAPAGILSLTRKSVWQQLGPWRAAAAGGDIVDSSMGAEDDMFRRFLQSGLPLQRAHPLVPVAASILTDPSGTAAKVRGAYRYGRYTPPAQDDFYYRIWAQGELSDQVRGQMPLSFEDWVQPLEGQLPLDEAGNLRKSSINMDIAERVGR